MWISSLITAVMINDLLLLKSKQSRLKVIRRKKVYLRRKIE